MSRFFKQPVIALQGLGIIPKRNTATVHMECLEEWFHPVAATADQILTAKAMPTAAAGEDVLPAALANQPDFPRNVTATGSAAQTAHIIVYGTDQFGAAISEELTLNGTSLVEGSKAFATITKIHLNQRSGAANVTVGVGSKLGTARHLLLWLPAGTVDGALEGTLPTLDAVNSTIVFNTALANTKVYIGKYWAKDTK